MRAERSPMRNFVQSNWMSGVFMVFSFLPPPNLSMGRKDIGGGVKHLVD